MFSMLLMTQTLPMMKVLLGQQSLVCGAAPIQLLHGIGEEVSEPMIKLPTQVTHTAEVLPLVPTGSLVAVKFIIVHAATLDLLMLGHTQIIHQAKIVGPVVVPDGTHPVGALYGMHPVEILLPEPTGFLVAVKFTIVHVAILVLLILGHILTIRRVQIVGLVAVLEDN